MAYLDGKPDIASATLKVDGLANDNQPDSAKALPWLTAVEQTIESGFEETVDARGDYGSLVERLDDTVTTAQVLPVPDPTSVPDGYVLTTSGGLAVWAAPSDVGNVPGQVTGLSATTGSGSGEIDATWTAPSPGDSAITTYAVQTRVTSVGGAWSPFVHSASTATSITITGLTPSTGYDVHVAAVSAIGPGPYSTTDTATSGGVGGGYSDTFDTLDPGWIPVSDATGLTVGDGSLQKTGGTGENYGGAVRELGSASGTLTVVANGDFPGLGDYFGIYFWYVDATNFCFTAVYGRSIFRVTDGVVSEIGTAAVAAPSDPLTHAVVLDEATGNIQSYANGVKLRDVTDLTIPTGTKHGVMEKLNNSALVTSFSFTLPE